MTYGPEKTAQVVAAIWPQLKGESGKSARAVYLEALKQASERSNDYTVLYKTYRIQSQTIGKKKAPYVLQEMLRDLDAKTFTGKK